MSRKIKVLGLALVAVLAVSAISATAASAVEKKFHSASVPVTLTGEQTGTHVFTTNAGTVTCKKAHFTGESTEKTTTTVTITFDYNECTAFGFVNVPIHENNCHYTFTSHKTVPAQALPTVHVDCPGNPIQITAPFCTTTVDDQTLEGIEYTNNATKTDVIVHANVAGITYNECGTVRNNGTYKGTTTVQGQTHAGVPVSVWYE